MIRKFTIGGALCAAFFLSACLKNKNEESCVTKTLEQDLPVMTQFATDSSITTERDEQTGLLYEILEPGNEVKPSVSSIITVKYVGRRMNGIQFDASESLRYSLSQLIPGWQVALPKIGVGGKMKIIIPSSLAYGCYTLDPVVSNQPLYFYIELLKVE